MTMTSASIRTTLAAVGNCGKTTIARHVLASGGSPIATLETHSASGEEADAIDRDGLAARLFAPPAGGVVIDVGVGDAVAALEALTLVGRQDPSLPKRLRLVVPLLVDGKSVAGLRWLLSQLPAALRPAVRAVWNRVRDEGAVRDSDIARAARAVSRQAGARLCAPVLRESPLFDPAHPLVRRYGSLEALASLPDDEIRAAPLADMSALLTGRDAAQSALADCRAVAAAIDE
jgi:hypothetical protein